MMKEDLEEMLRNMKKTLERINSDLEEAIKAVADCSARNFWLLKALLFQYV